jgi:HNH endonuclease
MSTLLTFQKQSRRLQEEDFQLDVSENPVASLFVWTLTHTSRAFSEVEPVFDYYSEFVNYVFTRLDKKRNGISEDHRFEVSDQVTKIAIEKIDREWNTWVNVHIDLPFDERKLDNMLMSAVYKIIIDRDLKMCVLCKASSNLTIHHIIQKRRNVPCTFPPFGRSVPTNLITLCRSCHARFDPMILTGLDYRLKNLK